MGEMYNRIVALCNKRGIKPGRVCADTGLSRGMMSDLKMGRTKELSAKNTKIIADYFGVTTDYLLTGEETKKAPDLTEKDRRDVAKLVETIMSDMEQAGDLNFDGMPLSLIHICPQRSCQKILRYSPSRHSSEHPSSLRHPG